jgi:transitional endoplasmic reticulum ATPase
MKPEFIIEMEEAFAVKQHVIFNFNTTDRFYWPEESIGPVYLPFFLAQLFNKKGFQVAQYASASGLKELRPDNKSKAKYRKLQSVSGQQGPEIILNTITSILRDKTGKWRILIQYGEHLAPANSIGISASAVPGQIQATELLHMLSFDDSITAGESRVVIVTYSEMPADLIIRSTGFRIIQVNLPCYEQRLEFIKFLDGKKIFEKLETGLSYQHLANITSGMPLVEIEKLFRSAAYYKTPVSQNQVKIAKARAIRQLTGDLLEVSEPEETLGEVAGLKHIKEFFIKLVPQLKESQKGVPQSILLNGIPGCGKSLVVSALANLLGWVLIQFRTIRGPYVGQSEQQLEHVIKIAEQFDRSIIFFDEIDQLIGQRNTGASGDSGTSERMLARIFSWIGSMKHRGKILFIGASNRPDLLDPAMIDRFRVSIPVLYPNQGDILELLPILMERFDRKFSKDISFDEASAIIAPLRPTGRSLQEIIILSGLRADDETSTIGSYISKKHFVNAAEDYLPSEDPLEMEFIALTSLSMCSANSFLPWMNINGHRPDAEIPEELIQDQIIDGKTGRLDKVNLHQKLQELSQTRQYARAFR